MRAGSAVVGGGWLLAACAAGTESGEPLAIETLEVNTLCSSESRSDVTALTYPNGAVGRVVLPNGQLCSGAVIGVNKVLTAAHCINDAAPSNLSFQPQFGIATDGIGPLTAGVTRYVQGEDFDDTQTASADFVILTIDRNLQNSLNVYQEMPRTWVSSPPSTVNLIGYPQDRNSQNRPVRENACTINTIFDDRMIHGCDAIPGASGGPLFNNSGVIVGIQSGGYSGTEACTGEKGPTAAHGRWFSAAPDNTAGLAVSYFPDGRTRVWATDRDWNTLAFRARKTTTPASAWEPWSGLRVGPTGYRKVTATNLQDNREVVFVSFASGAVDHLWQTSVGGGFTSSQAFPTPIGVKDIAVTGGSGNRTQVFVLGLDNALYTAHKTGGASSAWSSWVNLGAKSGARSIAAVRWNGMSVVFLSTSSGMEHTWGNDASFVALTSLGAATGGFKALSAGLLRDGRIHLHAVNGSNQYVTRFRQTDGSWTNWSQFGLPNPPNNTGFTHLAAGKYPDGRELLLAVTSMGEIYHAWETSNAKFTDKWRRFYK